MNEAMEKALAPLQAGRFTIGFVSAIHEKGAERPFEITEHELEQLARHWSREIKWIQDEWEYYQTSGSTESRLQPYAYYRLNKIGEVLGEDLVDQILDDVNRERFMTTVFEAPKDDGNPPPPGAKVYYTTRQRSIVFHHSRVGLRPMQGAVEVPGDGWCWQRAEDYKTAQPVEHVGFATAEAALEAAQQVEDAFFKEIEHEMEGNNDRHQQRERRVAEAAEELRKALAAHPVDASFRFWSDDRELSEKLKEQCPSARSRLEVRLRDGVGMKTSARVFIDWLNSEHWGDRVSVTVDAASEAWVRYEALVNALINLQRRFAHIGDYWSSINGNECQTILKAAGFTDVTRPKPQGAGLF